LLPGIAAKILGSDICKRCVKLDKTQKDCVAVYDINICHSGNCPLFKFHKVIGFRFNFSYTYPSGTEKIYPEMDTKEKING